jgi:hypothetical protein
MNKLREISKGYEKCKTRLPGIKIKLHMDHNEYWYKFEIAKDLIKRGKADYVDIKKHLAVVSEPQPDISKPPF